MPNPRRTPEQIATDDKKDKVTEHKIAHRRDVQQHAAGVQRAAAALPGMPGPKPGGLAESMANPQTLQDSLARSRQRTIDYENAKVQAGIKDTRLPAKTPGNQVSFAEGMTAKPGARMTINGNPRFAPRQPDEPAPPPQPTPVPGVKGRTTSK
jgi:hypothetical protein